MAKKVAKKKVQSAVDDYEEVKPKQVKEKKQNKSGGLLGKLIGGKNKRKMPVEDEYEDEYDDEFELDRANDEDYQEDIVPNKPQKTQQRNQSQAEDKPGRKAQTSGASESTSVSKPHSKPSTSAISKVYSQNKLEQNVFMYMQSRFFLGAQQYYNENFDYIKVMGTSSLDLLIDEFSTKTLCNAILLFVLTPNEVRPLHYFLSSIGFKDIDRRLLTVYMVVREGIDVDEILNDTAISDFISVSSYIRIDKEHPFTQTILDKAMSGVVQNQPMYTDEKVKKFSPQKIERKEQSLASIYKYDVNKLRERAEAVKKEMYSSANRAELIDALSSSDTKGIEETISNIDHIKLIEDVENTLTEHIETLKKSPHMKGEVKELIENKFLVSTYKAKEVESIIDAIISKVDDKLDAYDKSLTSINRNIFKELSELQADTREFIAKRDEVVKHLNKKCAEYKALTNLVENGYSMQSRYLSKTCNELAGLINDNASLPNDTVSVISTQVKRMSLEVRDIAKAKDSAELRLAKAINNANELLKEFQIVVECDSIIISRLCEVIEAQGEELATQNSYKMSMFRNVASAIVNIEGSGLDTVLRTISSSKELFVYMGDKDCSISDNQIDLKEFLSTSWTPEDRQVIMIGDEKYSPYWKDEKNIERVINKLNYVSKYFNNIYLIYSANLNENEIYNELFIRMVGEVGSVVYSIVPDLRYGTTVNMLHTFLLDELGSKYTVHKIVGLINKVQKETYEDLKDDLMTAIGYKIKPIRVPLRNDIANGTISENSLIKLKALKQYLR